MDRFKKPNEGMRKMSTQNNNHLINKISIEDEEDGTDKQPRLSFFYDSSAIRPNSNRERVLDEIDRVEQLITSNLQKINNNLVNSNNIISNKILINLEKFNKNSNRIYNNINHIKEFFENAANVNILTKKDIELVNEGNNTGNELTASSFIEVDESTGDNLANIPSTSFMNNTSHLNSENKSDNLSRKSLISSEISEFRDIKDRYKRNLNDDKDGDEGGTTTNTITNLHRFPDYSKEDSASTNTFLKGFNVHIDDESTGKQKVLHQKEEINEDTNPSNKYAKDIMSGYESPPWEDPPVLESSKFTSLSHNKKRKLNDTVDSIDSEDTEEELEKSDEDVSIRFPASPKYGAGGKLLRTDKGRQIALDFAKSEMMKNHPILSLQAKVHKDKNMFSTSDTEPTEKNPFNSTTTDFDQ